MFSVKTVNPTVMSLILGQIGFKERRSFILETPSTSCWSVQSLHIYKMQQFKFSYQVLQLNSNFIITQTFNSINISHLKFFDSSAKLSSIGTMVSIFVK